tara:strand:- start:101 stop:442 length:342 start_codon:yes stop_codon:yes gene_type:complete
MAYYRPEFKIDRDDDLTTSAMNQFHLVKARVNKVVNDEVDGFANSSSFLKLLKQPIVYSVIIFVIISIILWVFTPKFLMGENNSIEYKYFIPTTILLGILMIGGVYFLFKSKK